MRSAPAPFEARLLVAATALLFSTAGFIIKLTALNAWQVAGLRSALGAVTLILIYPRALRGLTWSAVPVAASFALTMILFVSATKLTTAANAVFLEDAAPVFVLVLAPLLLKEPIRRSDLVMMAAVLCGMALFFTAREPARATATNPLRGNICAAASALTWALTMIGLRWMARKRSSPGAMGTVVLGNILVAAAALPFAFPIAAFHARDATAIAWLGIFQVAVAYACLTRGIRTVPAFEASLILLLEPVLNPLWTWLVQGETPAAPALAGGAIILAVTLGNAWRPEP